MESVWKGGRQFFTHTYDFPPRGFFGQNKTPPRNAEAAEQVAAVPSPQVSDCPADCPRARRRIPLPMASAQAPITYDRVCRRLDVAHQVRLSENALSQSKNPRNTEGETPLHPIDGTPLMTKRRFLPRVALALLHAIAALATMHAAPPPDDLAAACRSGDLATVKRLLAAKADVTANDQAAAREANIHGHVEILRFLRAAGGSEKGAGSAPPPQRNTPTGMQPAPPSLSKLLSAEPTIT